MHLRTHVRAEHRGRYKHGDSEYIDGMIEHDETIGSLLKALDDMGQLPRARLNSCGELRIRGSGSISFNLGT